MGGINKAIDGYMKGVEIIAAMIGYTRGGGLRVGLYVTQP